MDRLHENRIYTGTVESYSSEGLGIVRLDGAVVFVPQAVRGSPRRKARRPSASCA